MSTSATVESLFLDGPAGRIEAVLNGRGGASGYAAVVCHPHPMFGGTLHNKVVFHTMKAIQSFSIPVLRFNFRGTGLSAGKHDHGQGEIEDVRTALGWMEDQFHRPLVLAGFSFGSYVGLRAACPDDRVQALIALGLPVAPIEGRHYRFDFLQDCRKPRLFASGEFDQYGTPSQLLSLVDPLPEPKKTVIVEGGDHFFEGRLPQLKASITDWLLATLPNLSDPEQ